MADATATPACLEENTKVKKIAEGIYEIDLAPAYCVGTGEDARPLSYIARNYNAIRRRG